MLNRIPVSITCGIFDDKFLIDLTLREEQVVRGAFTIVFDENDLICLNSQVREEYSMCIYYY